MKYQRNPQTNLQIRIIKKKSLRGRKDFQCRYVYQYLKFIVEDKNVDYDTLEKESVLKEAVKDCRDGESKSIIMHSTRVGLSDKQSDDFKNLQLRTIIGPLLSSYAYKEKEKVFRNYIVSDNISKEEAEKISIDILGYCPKSLIESVYQA